MIRQILWSTVIAILFVAYLLWDGRGATRAPQETTKLEMNLVPNRCNKPEMINRHLLQQSWFYDKNFSELAGAFGQFSFSLYQEGTDESMPIEGAFCIEGEKLYVRYFERRLVPVRIKPTEAKIEFGSKLDALGEDTFTVKELDKKRMVLFFASDGKEHVFYRRN